MEHSSLIAQTSGHGVGICKKALSNVAGMDYIAIAQKEAADMIKRHLATDFAKNKFVSARVAQRSILTALHWQQTLISEVKKHRSVTHCGLGKTLCQMLSSYCGFRTAGNNA